MAKQAAWAPDVSEIAAVLGGELHMPSPAGLYRPVHGIAPLESAGPMDLSFWSGARYKEQLQNTRAACVLVTPDALALVPTSTCAILVSNPYLAYARLTQWWRAHQDQDADGEARLHPSAVIHPSAQVHATARVGALCVVEAGAIIGAETRLHSRVTVGRGCKLGARCILHPGVVVGADGFGFAAVDGRWEKIEQLGAVDVGDDVEIGANTCIDRGALVDTVIEDGVKLDNLIQIGHNVRVGKHTAMAGCVGVAGSSTIGAHCTLGGGAVVLGHLIIADHVHVSAASVVTRSISEPGQYTGLFPIDDNAAWERNAAALKQLAGLRQRIRELEKL
ncbi:MAG: UDP-3-O-(3-hydroxymyristoyl)glucosamine N-acyltransferase, partial [Pseudomonadota bacterium]